MQEVNQNEDSQPPARPPLSGSVRLMISLFRLIFETGKKVVETSRSFSVFLRLSRLVLVATLILTIAMFVYTAFYQSVMPTEVAQWEIVTRLIKEKLFRFMKKTSTSSSGRAQTRPVPAAIRMSAWSWSPGDITWCSANVTESGLSWSCQIRLPTRDWTVIFFFTQLKASLRSWECSCHAWKCLASRERFYLNLAGRVFWSTGIGSGGKWRNTFIC